MNLPTPGTAEYDASIPPEWHRPPFKPLFTTTTKNNPTKETTMSNHSNTPIRDASVEYLEGEGWEGERINEYIEHVNHGAGTSWKPVAQERTIRITFTVTVEVEDVEVEDVNNIDVCELDLYDWDDAIKSGTILGGDYESVEVA